MLGYNVVFYLCMQTRMHACMYLRHCGGGTLQGVITEVQWSAHEIGDERSPPPHGGGLDDSFMAGFW